MVIAKSVNDKTVLLFFLEDEILFFKDLLSIVRETKRRQTTAYQFSVGISLFYDIIRKGAKYFIVVHNMYVYVGVYVKDKKERW